MSTVFERREQNFAVVGLRSEELEVAVVPELGAKLWSFRDGRTGYEWLWRAPDGRGLFRNQPGDRFEQSPMAGADECLPTILPCHWKGRHLPDHGEVWSVPWTLDAEELKRGRITTSVRLELSPFDFSRTVTLEGGRVDLEYTLRNRGAQAEEFIWTWHPLFVFEDGDALEIPTKEKEIRVEVARNPRGKRGDRWPVERIAAATVAKADSFLKAFLPSGEGRASIRHGGRRLTVSWSPEELPWLGVWVTRGGWNGFYHVALEPAHGAPDALDMAVQEWREFAQLSPGGERRWRVSVTLSGE